MISNSVHPRGSSPRLVRRGQVREDPASGDDYTIVGRDIEGVHVVDALCGDVEIFEDDDVAGWPLAMPWAEPDEPRVAAELPEVGR